MKKPVFFESITDEKKEIREYALSTAEERIKGLLYLQTHWLNDNNTFMNLTDDFYLDFLKLLEKHEVQYLLIGGFAVNFHGYPRTSHDMDIWSNPEPANAKKLLAAIDEFGFDISILEGIYLKGKDAIKLPDADFNLRKIEILADVSGLYDFEDAYAKKEVITYRGVPFNFLSYNDLIKSKSASWRYKDIEDIRMLEQIKDESNNKKGFKR
jgi:hypothetical protein